MKNLVIVSVLGLATSAFGSGFECTSNNGYGVKLFNKLGATRTPAVLIVTHDDADPSTQLRAAGSEIRKHNRATTTQYVVDGAAMELDKVIVQISFKEGKETLADGEIVRGQLILVDAAGYRDVNELECSRYLKSK